MNSPYYHSPGIHRFYTMQAVGFSAAIAGCYAVGGGRIGLLHYSISGVNLIHYCIIPRWFLK